MGVCMRITLTLTSSIIFSSPDGYKTKYLEGLQELALTIFCHVFRGKVTRILRQFTPHSWMDFDWRFTDSLMRWIGMLGIIALVSQLLWWDFLHIKNCLVFLSLGFLV